VEISLAAEKIGSIGPVSISNSLYSAFLIVFILGIFIIIVSRTFNPFHPSKLQLFFEMIVDGFKGMVENIIGGHALKLFPFLFTFFLAIVLFNWFGLLPFVGPIGIVHKGNSEAELSEDHHATFLSCVKQRNCYLTKDFTIIEAEKFTPLFRAPTSDVSATAALALISVIMTNILGLKAVGFKYLSKYLNFSSAMGFLLGILEIISELGKIISFTFRLFGNVFAGEVLLLVITSITYGVATLPFMGLEIFVGFIQAFVFFMLSTAFISVALAHHD
jgi:F-type H+-transporting ATPase subunit a